MIAIEDPDLPGLADLNEALLRRITGAVRVTPLRLRYRKGNRAILHLATGEGADLREGVVWFFVGDKARKLARRNTAARYDQETGALFEHFPNDHRMPQIRDFLDRYKDIAPALIAGDPDGAPVLLRYRPGLSCTFRCATVGEVAVYVKLINDDSPARMAEMNHRMGDCLHGGPVSVVPVVGIDPACAAIAYAAAPGVALDRALAVAGNLEPLHQTIDALCRFRRMPLVPGRRLDPSSLRSQARKCVEFVGVTAPVCRSAIKRLAERIDWREPSGVLAPIHGDMKLEHVFLDGGRTTLIDTESVSFGPPDCDLAQLCGRLWQAAMAGILPEKIVISATAEIRRVAGPGFDWCLDVTALRLAKFHAQRPAPGMEDRIFALLERLS